MKIIVVGAEGTVGRAVMAALGKRHEVVTVGRSTGDVRCDVTSRAAIEALYKQVGRVDAVVATAGHTPFAPVTALTETQFLSGLTDKLMGQVNLVSAGIEFLNDGGSFTLTSGILARDPVRMGACATMVNGAVEGFVRGAAIEMPRGIRINVVSPGLLEESAVKYDGYFPGHIPVSSARVGQRYLKSIEGAMTGQVIEVF